MTVTQLLSEPPEQRKPARANRRGQQPVDVTAFTGAVDQAMTAFQHDVSYAVSMARAAVIINRKRSAGWATRNT